MADLSQIPTDPLVQMLGSHPDVTGGQPTPQPKSAWTGPAWADPSGALSAATRAAANSATFNLADPVSAAIGAAMPIKGWTSTLPTYGQRYDQLLAISRGDTQQGAQSHPAVSMAANIAGGLANPVSRALPVANTAVGAIGQGAAIGAGYGAGTAISNQDSLPQAAGDIAAGAALGGAIPAVVAGVAPLARGVGNTAASVLGTTTGAGGRAIKGAFQAGAAGGDASDAFANNMRNNASMMDVVDQAKASLSGMRAQRNAQYRSGMLDISGDKSVLDFAPIQKAADDATNMQSYKGQTIGGDAGATNLAINNAITNWGKLNPSEYHTPEGLDFLKQQLGDIMANTKPNTVSSTMAGKVYNAVKGTIQDQAPTYAKVMSNYSDASESVNNIQRELSLGQKANPATALKKLQSVMRDNVNTSWGQRADYANQLNQGGTLMPALAGQALQSIVPRGLSGPIEVGGAILGSMAGAGPGILAAAPLASPRVMGETAYALGKGVGGLRRLQLPTIAPGAVSAAGASALVPALLPRLP